ncbi:MAG: primosomal protein N' [Nitrospirae bacterium]|nr:MAG: primosomal protein N' [Nitrospirota bacterium]
MSALATQYLQVAVPRRLYRVFTYATPPGIPTGWMPGMRVRVPFGRGALTGFVVAVTPHPETGGKTAPIREVIARLEDRPSISPDLLALTAWVAERYLAPFGQCLRLAFPGSPERTRAAVPAKHADETSAVAAGAAPGQSTCDESLAPLRAKALAAIARQTHASLLFPATTGALLGPCADAIQAVLDRGRTALVLVPETGRVDSLHAFFAARWGARCQAYHAGLSSAERHQAWARIQAGEAAVVTGTRSAVFAPLSGLGLLIVDQEDHQAYKAENVPRYDTRVVAAERARRAGAVLILASAHPSLETVHSTGTDTGALGPIVPQAGAPPVTVADLRDAPFGDILSTPLSDAIAARLADRRRVLLFLNRKGYASVLLCHDCGQAVKCPACSVGWTFHKRDGLLRCSYCGRSGNAPERCPACAGTRLIPSGSGTEALEEQVKARFPAARIARLERHRTGGDGANAAILSLWQAKELDILIGTQMVVTRRPPPVASLVGLVYPDAALHLPDFQAAERAYHTCSDVMALADPHDSTAGIVLQSYLPRHHVIRALAERNPSIFYESELAARQALGYPPFGRLIGLRVSGTKEDLVDAAATRWAALLRTAWPSTGKVGVGGAPLVGPPPALIEVLGPIPATPARVRGRFRRQLVVKGTDGTELREAVRMTLAEMDRGGRAGGLRYDIDVDPQSLM